MDNVLAAHPELSVAVDAHWAYPLPDAVRLGVELENRGRVRFLEAPLAPVFQSTVDLLGRLDVVVLAAAVMPVASARDTTDAQWRAAHDAILGTAFHVTRAALPHLRSGSAIVAVSSVNAFLAAPGLPAYASAKAGLEGLIRQLALEYGPAGIRANTVAPR